ncbi:hypothetical protein PRIPAC_81206 [Pristionchus pacificus]|uniref:Uncharacterized protein n=1 Tax=Pristionchus pacificus TaxID=54126 RepID=A0A2A6BI53_PRIPA|nr:hypothetical protein PRIPAC_81206 [Pristionchus pacificus]|eukprot:PDM65518.1 hypothetical protein PRIPAC_52460 [Pristionchus pacificus]
MGLTVEEASLRQSGQRTHQFLLPSIQAYLPKARAADRRRQDGSGHASRALSAHARQTACPHAVEATRSSAWKAEEREARQEQGKEKPGQDTTGLANECDHAMIGADIHNRKANESLPQVSYTETQADIDDPTGSSFSAAPSPLSPEGPAESEFLREASAAASPSAPSSRSSAGTIMARYEVDNSFPSRSLLSTTN